MSSFNTRHIPIREIDAGGPALANSPWERFHVVFACSKTVSRGQASYYTPAKNRKTCRGCRREWDGHTTLSHRLYETNHTVTGETESGMVLLACGQAFSQSIANQQTKDWANKRPCPGCEVVLNGTEKERAAAMAGTAKRIYQAIKTATGDQRRPKLVHTVHASRAGFYRVRPNGKPQGDRILEEASGLMELVARSCPATLRYSFNYEDGKLTIRPAENRLAREHLAVNIPEIESLISQTTSMANLRDRSDQAQAIALVIDQMKEGLNEVLRNTREKLPDILEQEMEKAGRVLEGLGFQLEHAGNNLWTMTTQRTPRKKKPDHNAAGTSPQPGP